MSSDDDLSITESKLDVLIKQFADFSNYTKRKLDESNKAINRVLELQELQNKEIISLKKENTVLKDKVGYLENKVNILEKQALSNTMCLHPIPRTKDEDLISVIKRIGKAVDVNLSSFNIVKVFRRRDKKDGRPGDVVLECNTNAVKASLVELIKNKNIKLADIGFSDKVQKLYANQELTCEDKKLFYTALKNKGKQNWIYVWNSNGNILVRIKEGEKPVKITSMSQLDGLMKCAKV